MWSLISKSSFAIKQLNPFTDAKYSENSIKLLSFFSNDEFLEILDLFYTIKFAKPNLKQSYKQVRVVLYKKRLQKHLIVYKWDDPLKIGKNAHHAKAIAHARWSV